MTMAHGGLTVNVIDQGQGQGHDLGYTYAISQGHSAQKKEWKQTDVADCITFLGNAVGKKLIIRHRNDL